MDGRCGKLGKLIALALLLVFIDVFGGLISLAVSTPAGFLSVPSAATSRPQALFATELAEDAQSMAPYVPTPQEVVDRMLEMAELKKKTSSTTLARATAEL